MTQKNNQPNKTMTAKPTPKEEIIRAIASSVGPIKESEIEEKLWEHKTRKIHTLLNELEQNENIIRIEQQNSISWTLSNEQKSQTSDNWECSVRQDDFSVRISQTKGSDQLLLQESPSGYQLTAWWTDDGGEKHSSDIILDHPISNKEKSSNSLRTPIITGEESTEDDAILKIIDPDPNVENLENPITIIYITHHEEGFKAALNTIGETDTQQNTQFLPFIDPREDLQKFLKASKKTPDTA